MVATSFDGLEKTVEINNLTFTRSNRVIFNDISVIVPKGKITAIMGPSGCGKTTLLRLIGRQLEPEAGQVILNGQDIAHLSRGELYHVRKAMGMLFQSGALFSDLNVFENVAFPLREHTNLPEDMIRDLVLMKLEAVGLRGAFALMPSELSGGMSRRVALARAIALDPDLIMYDEPFVGQDPISLGILVQLIKLLNDALGITTIIVSHDIRETISIADYAYLVSGGRIVAADTPENLLESNNDWVKQFMQGLPDGPVPFHHPAQDYAVDLLGTT